MAVIWIFLHKFATDWDDVSFIYLSFFMYRQSFIYHLISVSPECGTYRWFWLVSLLWLVAASLPARRPLVLPQHDMHRWGVPAGDYSGITPIGGNRYALISDKQSCNGWHEVDIRFKRSGDIRSMKYLGFHADSTSMDRVRDAEDIVCVEGRFFVSAEDDQQILELDAFGKPTGRQLMVPDCFSRKNIYTNNGFEALAYDAASKSFWTTTEQGLCRDIHALTSIHYPEPTLLRLQRFNAQLQPSGQFAYRTDAPRTRLSTRYFGFGVPAMTVLNDSTLLVMERELYMSDDFRSSCCFIKIFSVDTRRLKPLQDSTSLLHIPDELFAAKRLLVEFSTSFSKPKAQEYANYEGMCLGPVTAQGRQTLLLVADSQCRKKRHSHRMKDRIRVIVL